MQTVTALGRTPAKTLPLVRQRFGAGSNGSCAYLVGRDDELVRQVKHLCVERGVGLDKS